MSLTLAMINQNQPHPNHTLPIHVMDMAQNKTFPDQNLTLR
jgi:hypothetical protein